MSIPRCPRCAGQMLREVIGRTCLQCGYAVDDGSLDRNLVPARNGAGRTPSDTCQRGHPLTGGNLYVTVEKGRRCRRCRACTALRRAKWAAEQRARQARE